MRDIEYYIHKGFVFIPHYTTYTLAELKFVVSKMEEEKAKLEKEDYFKHQKELLE